MAVSLEKSKHTWWYFQEKEKMTRWLGLRGKGWEGTEDDTMDIWNELLDTGNSVCGVPERAQI